MERDKDKRCETCRYWDSWLDSEAQDERIPGHFWAVDRAMFLTSKAIGRCNAEPKSPDPHYRELYTESDQGENCPLWEEFKVDFEISGEEAGKAGSQKAAQKVKKACRDLTRVFGRKKNPPPLMYHHIDCTREGVYVNGVFVWDGSRYRFEGYHREPQTGQTKSR